MHPSFHTRMTLVTAVTFSPYFTVSRITEVIFDIHQTILFCGRVTLPDFFIVWFETLHKTVMADLIHRLRILGGARGNDQRIYQRSDRLMYYYLVRTCGRTYLLCYIPPKILLVIYNGFGSVTFTRFKRPC